MKTLARILGVVALALALAPAARGALDAQVPKHNCSFCHNLHGGSYAALADSATSQALCQGCHGDAGPAQWNRDGTMVDIPKQQSIHNGSKHTAPTTCWDCHDHEGSASGNLFMIPRTKKIQGVDTTIIFTSDATQAGFTGVNGVCYVCHTQAGPKANGLSGHNGPDVCTFCHTHDAGFQGAGGSCTSCHNSPRGNHREVVSEFDRTSHHVQLGGAGADIPEADCVVCHDQNSIVGIDLTAHPRGGSDHVVLINQDGGAPITYDPGVTDPSVLTPFCLSCHDVDGGVGGDTSPFSDGIVRPLIDETAWNVSSHKTSTSADCADCHEVHGSQKVKLLRPGSVVPNATTKVEQEEGFCFQCHKSGGPASTNIQAQFDPATINWAEGSWGEQNITTFNDRHDVQHEASSVSGAKIECVNCHRPHADNATLKYNPDPDPASAAVTWTGQTTMDRFCVDCHDNTFPPGVQGYTAGAMVDVATAYTGNDSHGVPTTTGALHNAFVLVEKTRGAGGTKASGALDSIPNPWVSPSLMQCAQCHRPHPKTAAQWPGTVKFDFFSLQDTVRHPDGRGIAYWQVAGSGMSTYIQEYWDYGLSEDSGVTEANAGGWYCNVCHDRRGMNGNNTCGSSGCHRHGGKL